MSGFGAPGGPTRLYKPSPPERGSFPLDHDGECKHLMKAYLSCLKKRANEGVNSEECREHAKGYLGCRMEKGLMAKDNWDNLGFGVAKEDGEVGEKVVGKTAG